MEPQNVPMYMQVMMWAVGIVVAISIPLVGWAFKIVHKRIDDLKADTDKQRIETRDYLLEIVETKFEAIKETLRDIKEEIKRHYAE